ncbi:hypothetical protein HHI36_016315, partial [Cryptolaemus montrouzieri]
MEEEQKLVERGEALAAQAGEDQPDAIENTLTRNLLRFSGINAESRFPIPRLKCSEKFLNTVREM